MDAKFNLLELKRKEVIPDGLVTKIDNADDRTARELLFEHLHCYADVTTLREYCRITISKDGYPKMQALGKKMLHDLPPEGLLGLVRVCVCVCVCVCVSQLLFDHLSCHANAKLREYCRIAISAGAFPKMQDFREKMLRNLPPEVCWD